MNCCKFKFFMINFCLRVHWVFLFSDFLVSCAVTFIFLLFKPFFHILWRWLTVCFDRQNNRIYRTFVSAKTRSYDEWKACHRWKTNLRLIVRTTRVQQRRVDVALVSIRLIIRRKKKIVQFNPSTRTLSEPYPEKHGERMLDTKSSLVLKSVGGLQIRCLKW